MTNFFIPVADQQIEEVITSYFSSSLTLQRSDKLTISVAGQLIEEVITSYFSSSQTHQRSNTLFISLAC